MAKDDKKKEKKNGCCQEVAGKVEVIYEILSAHKMDLELIEGKLEEMSSNVDRVKGRMGI
jgi:hypothetical protein|tara:strand:+ start:359 stop:538 length:180 start_codon:yes stop_codon:yes gene_type:complete